MLLSNTVFGPFSIMYPLTSKLFIVPPTLLLDSRIRKSEVFFDKKFAVLNPEIPPPIITVSTFKALV